MFAQDKLQVSSYFPDTAAVQEPRLQNHPFPGVDLDVCVNNAFGCCMAPGCFRSQSWKEDELNYFLPELQSKASASTALTNQLKHLIPGESAQSLIIFLFVGKLNSNPLLQVRRMT